VPWGLLPQDAKRAPDAWAQSVGTDQACRHSADAAEYTFLLISLTANDPDSISMENFEIQLSDSRSLANGANVTIEFWDRSV